MELIKVVTFKIIFICLQNYVERYYISTITICAIQAKLGRTKHWHQPYIGNTWRRYGEGHQQIPKELYYLSKVQEKSEKVWDITA